MVMAAAAPAVEVRAFIDDMAQAFADADLIVCRSGASTVAEIAAAGKCALFVPFPGAADDHQLRNAELLASEGAALLIPEAELTAEKFVDQIVALLSELPNAPALPRCTRIRLILKGSFMALCAIAAPSITGQKQSAE